MIAGLAHILICRTDNIGDVVLTLPLAAYLKKLYPEIRIGFLCRGYAAPVAECCDAIDYVVTVDSLSDPFDYLAKSGIDTIIFCKPDRRLAAAAKKARISNRVGSSHRWYHWLYCNRLAHFSRVKSSLHEAQLNFALLRPLGIAMLPALAEIVPLYRLRTPRRDGLPTLAGDGFHLILHPRSNGNGREWPIDHYAGLARLLQQHADIRLWITGSQRESEWLAANAAGLLAMPNVCNVCGKFGLGELISFIDAAGGLVASGTGPMHISAALGKPTLGLFPPLPPIDPARWGALGTRARVLCQEQTCGGCKDAASCACMRNIAPGHVAEVVLQWREAARAGSGNASGASH